MCSPALRAADGEPHRQRTVGERKHARNRPTAHRPVLGVRSGIWDADAAREVLATPARVKRLGAVGFDGIMSATAWHPRQHVIAIGAFGDGAPIRLDCREVRQ